MFDGFTSSSQDALFFPLSMIILIALVHCSLASLFWPVGVVFCAKSVCINVCVDGGSVYVVTAFANVRTKWRISPW